MEKLKKMFHPVYLSSILICCCFWACVSGTIVFEGEIGSSIIPMFFAIYNTILFILLIKKKKLGYIMQALSAVTSALLGFVITVIGVTAFLSPMTKAIIVIPIGVAIMAFQYYAIKYYDKEDKLLYGHKCLKPERQIEVKNETKEEVTTTVDIIEHIDDTETKSKKKTKSNGIDKLYGKYLPLYYIVFFNFFTISTYHFTGYLLFFPTFLVSFASICLGFGLMKRSKTAYQMQYIFNSLVSLTLFTQIIQLLDEISGTSELLSRIIMLLMAPVGIAIHIYAMIYLSKKKKRYLKKNKPKIEPQLKLNNWFSFLISIAPILSMPCIADLFYPTNSLSIRAILGEIANPVVVLVFAVFLIGLFPLTGYLLRKRTKYGYFLQFATNGILIIADLLIGAIIILFLPAMIAANYVSVALLFALIVAFFITIKVGIMSYYVKNKEHFLVDSSISKDESGKIENIDETIKTEVLVRTEMTKEIINKTEETKE